MPISGEPMLAHVVARTRRSARLDETVVATTTLPEDGAIVELGRKRGWAISRGSEQDLLDRFVQTARTHHADIVVRITSDCPLIDPQLIDATVERFLEAGVDYASISLEPRTYPRGLDVEVVTRDALELAWRDDDRPEWREHATPYIYRHPERFRLLRVAGDEDHSEHRWSVDTAEDLELVRRIFHAIGPAESDWRVALAAVEATPEWLEINRHVPQKSVPPA
jgi:spore coat polysaccharide biosynthesis protein SpsF